jgi:hypothetical protein
MENFLLLVTALVVSVLVFKLTLPLYVALATNWLIQYSEVDRHYALKEHRLSFVFEEVFKRLVEKHKILSYKQLRLIEKIDDLLAAKYSGWSHEYAKDGIASLKRSISDLSYDGRNFKCTLHPFYMRPLRSVTDKELKRLLVTLERVQNSLRFNQWLLTKGLALMFPFMFTPGGVIENLKPEL